MRLYIAGPMSGIKDLNFPAFHAVAEKLRQDGHDVVNLAEINAGPGAAWADCMRADIAQLVTCDGIVRLPGWDTSRGATLENHIACTLGLSSYDWLNLQLEGV